MPVQMPRTRFEELVSEALDLIPAEFAKAMTNVVVLVEEHNAEEPSILGLYQGIALTERTTDYGGVLPDRISIYREPILSVCETEEDVIAEVAITVVHEISLHTTCSAPPQLVQPLVIDPEVMPNLMNNGRDDLVHHVFSRLADGEDRLAVDADAVRQHTAIA
jgi:predicted Zn-dependent protease with MMP-like domain